MLRKIAPVLIALVIALTATSADAFFMTCGDARALSESGDDIATASHAFGALDAFAGLLCFVGDAKCGCLIDAAANRPREFSRQFNIHLENCGDSDPAFGVAFQAAEALCAN